MTNTTLTKPTMTAEKSMFLGQHPAQFQDKEVKGAEVTKSGETFYKISNADGMRPFFMSIVSNSNQWMFISSK